MKNLDTLESELRDHWKKWLDVPPIGQNFDRAAVRKAVEIFYEGEGLPAPILVFCKNRIGTHTILIQPNLEGPCRLICRRRRRITGGMVAIFFATMH